MPKGNGTQAKDHWEVPTLPHSSDSIEPDSEAPSTSVLEEEEGLLLINQSKGAPRSSQRPKVTSTETVHQDLLYSILFSTTTSRMAAATEVAVDRQEEESAPEHASSGFDLGSSMGPSLLPLSSILSGTPEGPQSVSEGSLKSSSESMVATVGGAGTELVETLATVAPLGADVREVETAAGAERQKPTVGAGLRQADSTPGAVAITATETVEMEHTEEGLLLMTSHLDGTQITESVSRTSGRPPSPSSSLGFWDWTDKPAPTPTPTQNSTKLPVIATATPEEDFEPQTGDARVAVLATEMPWNLPQVTIQFLYVGVIAVIIHPVLQARKRK